MSAWPRENESNSPSVAFKSDQRDESEEDGASIGPPATATRPNIADSAAARSPDSISAATFGFGPGRGLGEHRERDRHEHRDAPEQQQRVKGDPAPPPSPLAHLVGVVRVEHDPRDGISSSSPACRMPRICGMCAPTAGATVPQMQRVHICCIRTVRRNAMEPTTIGNQVGRSSCRTAGIRSGTSRRWWTTGRPSCRPGRRSRRAHHRARRSGSRARFSSRL